MKIPTERNVDLLEGEEGGGSGRSFVTRCQKLLHPSSGSHTRNFQSNFNKTANQLFTKTTTSRSVVRARRHGGLHVMPITMQNNQFDAEGIDQFHCLSGCPIECFVELPFNPFLFVHESINFTFCGLQVRRQSRCGRFWGTNWFEVTRKEVSNFPDLLAVVLPLAFSLHHGSKSASNPIRLAAALHVNLLPVLHIDNSLNQFKIQWPARLLKALAMSVVQNLKWDKTRHFSTPNQKPYFFFILQAPNGRVSWVFWVPMRVVI